jgi:hypothetical protein
VTGLPNALRLIHFLSALMVCSLAAPDLCSAARNSSAPQAVRIGNPRVVALLFEADVRFNTGFRRAALEMYGKADESGTCPPGLRAAYAANGGSAERLYLDMEAAKAGDMRALRAALDRLYLGRNDPEVDPQLALSVYEVSKRAAPKASFEGEPEIAELLRMSAAPGAFDIVGFLRKHTSGKGVSTEESPAEQNPYFLWDLAEELSSAQSAEKANAELVLQLVARGGGTLSERLSAVRAAFKNWKDKRPAAFSCLEHLSGPVSVRHAFGRGLAQWERNQSQRTAALLAVARAREVGPLLERALESANTVAVEKVGNLHCSDRYSRAWQKGLFLRWELEKALRLMESAFSGSKPEVSQSPGEALDAYNLWKDAATTSLPEHLQNEDLADGVGPCLAFPYRSDLANVLGRSEAFIAQCAELFARVNSSLSQESWRGLLTAELMRQFDGTLSSLERRHQATTGGLTRERPDQGSLRTSQTGAERLGEEASALESVLATFRAGLKGGQAVLFDAMQEGAVAWMEQRVAASSGELGRAGGSDGPKRDALRYTWLRDMQPLLAGCVPSFAVPVGFADPVLRAQLKASTRASAAASREGGGDAWVEYGNRAARFLHSLSPSLGEEDWMGWLSLQRAFEIPGCALLYTQKEKEWMEDEGHNERAAESESKFKRMEAVFKDARSMDVDLKDVEGLVSSEDGRLRIVSWNAHTGGTMRDYCAIAQFRGPDGRVGCAVMENPDNEGEIFVGVFGEVSKIETVVTDSKEAIYMIWSHGKSSAHRWSDSVTALLLRNGRLEKTPFFQTKKNLLSRIEIEYGSDADEAGAGFRFSKNGNTTFLVPVISDQFQFSGKFFKYVFDGKKFVFSGFQ